MTGEIAPAWQMKEGCVNLVNATFANLIDGGSRSSCSTFGFYEVDKTHMRNLGGTQLPTSSIGAFSIAAEAQQLGKRPTRPLIRSGGLQWRESYTCNGTPFLQNAD